MGIIMAIFAVLAFDLFGDRDFDNFGSFSRSYFTMFQASYIYNIIYIRYHIHIYNICNSRKRMRRRKATENLSRFTIKK